MTHIGDYALLGDCHGSALVGKDGSIDWACFARFDAPAVFCRILDADRGGCFSIRPEGLESMRRQYLEDTNVLQTTFACADGELELTDCMPIAQSPASGTVSVSSYHAVLRHLRCIRGEVDVRVLVEPRFEYGSFVPRFRLTSPTTGEIVGGADAMWVSASRPLEREPERFVGRWVLRAGDEACIEAAWSPSHSTRTENDFPSAEEMARRLEGTIDFWRQWIARCWYEGEYTRQVRRSALVLKALTYAPTGAVVAAPTTSLPEEIGGVRNWDYRYTWIRDATMTLISLFELGYREEADNFKVWLERTGAGRPQDLQIMYGICGERALPELELSHLAGHRGSAPVRIGNGAAGQMQLDAYGQILEAAFLYGKAGGSLTPENWTFLSGLADEVCDRWRQRDHGIWEMRDTPRHFVHSKLYCWVALDRALKLAGAIGSPAPSRWSEERAALRAYLLEEGAAGGWFRQAVGIDAADASTLLVPAMGLVATRDPRVLKTIEVIRRDLEQDGLIHRYLSADGLQGGEGAFLLCSFWLLDCLIHAGELDEAEVVLQRLLGLANDVGLFAEEVEPKTEEHLGNFPQAFTHMALVASCAHLSAAKAGKIPMDGAHDYAELAIDRLLAAGVHLTPTGGGV